ncbi:hypothetical protein RRG08_004831 [Elysia crispata]|uniref:IgGFc-binding protein N-terminal domain-containing protein n=1 Tax=Elysia crispata TaxID=231223 RepID=A0AAE1CSJ6_9GAST|nr:hypothetical protein RRG08_004831 [Elysia crispata]
MKSVSTTFSLESNQGETAGYTGMANWRDVLTAAFVVCLFTPLSEADFFAGKDQSQRWEGYQLTAPRPHGQFVQLSTVAHIVGGERQGRAWLLAHRGVKEEKLQEFVTSNKNRTVVRPHAGDHAIRVDSPSTHVLANLQATRGVIPTFTLLDAHSPIPDRCLGTKYVVAPVESRGGHSFVVVKSLNEETMVYLTLDNDVDGIYGGLLEIDGRLYGPGDTVIIKMKPHASKTLSSVDVGSGLAVAGISVVTSHPVAVYSGSVASEPSSKSVNAKRVASAVSFEMLPPLAMLGTHLTCLKTDFRKGKVRRNNSWAMRRGQERIADTRMHVTKWRTGSARAKGFLSARFAIDSGRPH